MKKRLFNLILALVMVACIMPMAASAVEYAGDTCTSITGQHDWEDGSCTWCTLPCKHDFDTNSKCKNCDVTCQHTNKKYEDAVPATCKSTGMSGGYVCPDCGYDERTVEPKTSHNYVEEVSIAPTCTAGGMKRSRCSVCGSTKLEWPAKLPHTPEDVAAVPATCTTPGQTAGQKCKICGTKLSGMEAIGLIPHDFAHGPLVQYIKVPTCQEAGSAYYECANEGCTEREERALAMLPHTVEAVEAVPATCAAAGNTAGTKCSVCDTILSGVVEIEKLPHTPGRMIRYIKRPTCKETGSAEYACTECADGTVTQVVRVLNCNIVDIAAVPATCDTDGTTAGQECTVCKEKGADHCAYCAANVKAPGVDPKGHLWVTEEVYREATCTATGAKKLVCERDDCGQSYIEEIPMIAHTEVALEAVEPSCKAVGMTEGKKCSVCNEILVAQEVIPMAEHTWETVEGKNPTCSATGLTEGKECSECGAVLTAQQEIPKEAHNYVGYQCTVCKAYDPNHKHEGSVISTDPATCTEAGSETYGCDDCAYEWTETIAAKGHKFENGTCSVCDAPDPGHTHTLKQTGYRAPTCTVHGQVTKACTVCGHQEQTLIDMLGHSYSDGKCSRCGVIDPDSICRHTNHGPQTIKPTCTTDGSTREVCKDCGVTIGRVTIIRATGHKHVNGICSVCGHLDSNRITNDFQDIFLVG